jgi:hypothetical protein
VTETLPQKRDKNANLIPHRFKKGEARARMSPGRPKKLDWVYELEALAQTPKERKPFLERLLRKHPVDAMHYIVGKPRETVVIDQTLKAEIATSEVIDAARQIRAEIEKQAKTELSVPVKAS